MDDHEPITDDRINALRKAADDFAGTARTLQLDAADAIRAGQTEPALERLRDAGIAYDDAIEKLIEWAAACVDAAGKWARRRQAPRVMSGVIPLDLSDVKETIE